MPPTTQPDVRFDDRFSNAEASALPWSETWGVLERAELYWLATVRSDGRPHVTPLIAVIHGGALHFTTGLREQKARNLEANPRVALTTGNNAWAQGLDVVVEGTAERITDNGELQGIADAFEAKYGSEWHFDVGDGALGTGQDPAVAFRIEAAKVIAFAKEPHGQTTYRFDRG
jgi:hypothetical protein